MKSIGIKKVALLILILAMVILALTLSGCIGNEEEPGNQNPGGGNETPVEPAKGFINVNYIGYSMNYVPKEGWPKDGFLLYDTIYFSRLYYENITLERYWIPEGELFYEGEKVLDLEADSSTQKFSDVTLDFGPGRYRCDTSVRTNGQWEKYSFEFGVSSGGRPDEVRYLITENGEETEECVGGKEYAVTAQFYSEGDILENYPANSTWIKGIDRMDSMTFSYGKLYRSAVCNALFCFDVENSEGRTRRIEKEFRVTVKDNLDRSGSESGIYVDFGEDFDGALKANSGTAHKFWRYSTVEYRFTDGTVQRLNYAEREEDAKGDKGLYYHWKIRYDGEGEYKSYREKDYDYSLTERGNWNITYYGDNSNYQLDPTKERAELCVAVWNDTEGTPIEVQIGKTPITSLEITGITGRRKEKYTSISSAKSLRDYTAAAEMGGNGEKHIQAVVACDWNGDGKVTADEWGKVWGNSAADRSKTQYFYINVATNADTDVGDYYLQLEYFQGGLDSRPVEVYTYQSTQSNLRVRHFYAQQTGQCRVTVRSHVNPDLTDSAIITVVDPVEKLEIDREYLPNMIALPSGRDAVAVDVFNVVKEYRLSSYSNKEYRSRSLTEGEGLVAIPQNKAFSNQFISVRYELRGESGLIDTETVSDCVLVPDFTIAVEGSYPDTRWATVTGSDKNVKWYRENAVNNAGSNQKEFSGYLPNLTVESPPYFSVGQKASDVTIRVNDNSAIDDYRLRKSISENGDLVVTVEYIYRIKGAVYTLRVGTFTLKCGNDWVWQFK